MEALLAAAALVVAVVSPCLLVLKAAPEVLVVLDEATLTDRTIGARQFSGMEALAATAGMMMIPSKAAISSRVIDHLSSAAMVGSTDPDLVGLESALDVEVTLLVCAAA